MLFAITQIGTWFFFVTLVVWLSVIGHSIFARRPKDRSNSVQPRLSTLVFVVPLVFSANWTWLSNALPPLAWLMWIGDQGHHWFYRSSTIIAAVAAGIVSMIVALRVLGRFARPGYAKIQFLGAATKLILFGLLVTCEYASHIRGTDPKSAAERVVRELELANATTALELREETQTPTCITYLIVDGEDSVGYVSVCRYGWWWWRFAGSSGVDSTEGGQHLNSSEETAETPPHTDGEKLK